VDATGRERLRVGAARVAGVSGDPRMAVSRPRVTLCDCGAGPPSWEIRGSSATVVAGSHAWLLAPVFWVTPRFLFVKRPIPVFVLPFAYLPLSDRQTGLLFPEVGFGRGGLTLSQPLFLALSRSWDATVTLDGAFGDQTAQLTGTGDFTQRAVRGVGSSLELRWAPSEGTAGRARLLWLRDESRDCVARAPEGGCEADALSPAHGDRIALAALHQQRLAAGTDLRVDLGLVNDPLYLSDLADPMLLRTADYRRSSIWLAQRAGDAVLAAEAAYHLPFTTAGYSTLGQQVIPVDPATDLPRVPYGLFGSEVPVVHRMPSLTASLLPIRLAGSLALSGSASLSRFAPLRGTTGDEGADGIGPGGHGFPIVVRDPVSGVYSDRDPGERNGQWEPGERLAVDRAAIRAEVRAPVPLGGWATLDPWVRGFAAGYAFEEGPDPQGNGRVAGGLALSTRLTRAFGRMRHDVEPRVEWRLGTPRLGPALPAPAWDELDAAARPPGGDAPGGLRVKTLSAVPDRSFHQASLSLRNRVHAGPATALDLLVGQDVDLAAGRLAEAYLQATLAAWRLRLGGDASFYPDDAPESVPLPGFPTTTLPSSRFLDAFSFLGATAALVDSHGDVHGTFTAMGPSGSQRLAAGLETLLDPQSASVTPFASGTAGITLRLGGASLSYDAAFNVRELAAPLVAGAKTAPHVYHHALVAGWSSPCKCFHVAVGLSKLETDPPRFLFQFGLNEVSGIRVAPDTSGGFVR
jgi:LPS-assembly protein